MGSLSQHNVSVICMILQAYRELYEVDKDKYYSKDEFCAKLNLRPFNHVTIEEIKSLITQISFSGLIAENHLNKGTYKWNDLPTQGLTNV